NNCFKNTVLPIVLDADVVDGLFQEMYASESYQLSISLEKQIITKPNGDTIAFDVDNFRKHCLLNGLDDIGITLQDAELIRQFEVQWKEKSPWIFNAL
ncbi:MAG: 3-isopropylmalate dehydratase small subunit, partial [Spongiibacteraceae bacterium]|nr:3-isopropylmalate dehydratase small subunit [Spongiibacteraceae bacterium]